MKCKQCKDTSSWHDWAQAPYCSPYCKHGGFTPEKSIQGEWGRHAAAELKEHATETLQPVRKDGTVNPAFVKAHGTKSLEKEWKVPRRAILENVERYG